MFNRKQTKLQSDFDAANRRFNLMWKLVLGFIFLVTCVVLAIWGLVGYGVYKYGPKAVQTGEHVLERLDREASSDLN